MTEFYDKYSVHQILMQPVKLFGQPKTRDKIDVLNSMKPYANLSDIEYVYPLVFVKNTELAATAAKTVIEVMKKFKGKQWNSVYEEVKYTKIDLESMVNLLNFPPDLSRYLLGVASLNSNGYIREKAKNLLNSWLIRSASLYSRPDGATGRKIAELFETIRNKGQISSNAFRQLQFVIETRR